MKVLVTGATGFLGGAICERLLNEGVKVRASGRNLAKGKRLSHLGAEFISSDLCATEPTRLLCEGVDYVIHSGALSSLWGPRQIFWETNVVGTRSLLEGALSAGVKRFVHVSSPSVYFNFVNAVQLDEDSELPQRFANDYTASKYAAEEEVQLAVQRGLSAIILRPRALFGPGDTAIFPRILLSLKSGRLKVIGTSDNRSDLTYIDNAVEACLLALRASEISSGRVFNITDGASIELWPLLCHIADRLGYKPPRSSTPLWLARFAARSLERYHRAFKPDQEPLFTEYSVGILGCSISLDITRAREELNYVPLVSTEEGIERFLSWWVEQEAQGPSVGDEG